MKAAKLRLWRDLFEVAGAGVQLVHEFGEFGGRLGVGWSVLRVSILGASEKDMHEGPQASIPFDILMTLQGWSGEVCQKRRHQSALGDLQVSNSILFCSLFVNNHAFAWRANQWPLVRETLFSVVPPSNSLVPVSDPWRAFWADTTPFKGPRLALCVASGTSEIHGYRQKQLMCEKPT